VPLSCSLIYVFGVIVLLLLGQIQFVLFWLIFVILFAKFTPAANGYIILKNLFQGLIYQCFSSVPDYLLWSQK